jgi:hypothetical protein
MRCMSHLKEARSAHQLPKWLGFQAISRAMTLRRIACLLAS